MVEMNDEQRMNELNWAPECSARWPRPCVTRSGRSSLLAPRETWDVSFVADNPGLWMLHCHMLLHAATGMDMMVVYPDISTPYVVGGPSGNDPE